MTATMEPLVDTLIEDERWQSFGLAGLADRAARATLAEVGPGADGFEISLLGCNDSRISELNAEFRGKPLPTNVLSWPSEDRGAADDGGVPQAARPGPPGMPEELGDIAIAWETCEREAREQGKTMVDHVCHLVVHGVLHLLGYDHIRDRDADLMEAAEVRILAKMGMTDPYECTGAGTA